MENNPHIALLLRHGFFGKEVKRNGRPSISLERLMGRTFRIPKYRWIPSHERHYCVYNELKSLESRNGRAPGRTAKDVAAICNISADIDTGTLEEQLQRIKDLPLKPSAVIFTGGKGFHIHYTLEERLTDIERGREVQNALILKVEADKACKDACRLLAHPYAPYVKTNKEGEVIKGWPAHATCGIASGERYSIDQVQEAFGRVPLKGGPMVTAKPRRSKAEVAVVPAGDVGAEGDSAGQDFWGDDLSFLDDIHSGSSAEDIEAALFGCRDPLLRDALGALTSKKNLKGCPKYAPGKGDGNKREALLKWCFSQLNRIWFDRVECAEGVYGSEAGWVKLRNAFQKFFERWLPQDAHGRVSDAVGRAERPEMSDRCKFAKGLEMPNPTKVACTLYWTMKPSYNEFSKQLMTDGKPLTGLETLNYRLLMWGYGYKDLFGELSPFSKSEVEGTYIELAKHYFNYHPLRDYLKRVHLRGPRRGLKRAEWERMASVFLQGETDLSGPPTLADIQLRKWIVSAVKRTMEPGCPCHSMFVLKGVQGIGKSTFFRTLTKGKGAPDGWFNDSQGMKDLKSKDQIMGFHTAGIYEIQEFKLRKEDVEDAKGFLTTQSDSLRPPYGRLVETWDRSFVICATTNDETFFVDETGNRRFWVVESHLRRDQRIDNVRLKEVVDDVWAYAMQDYKAGYSTFLSVEEEKLNDANNKTFQNEDPVEGMVEAAIWGTDGEHGETCPVYRMPDGELLINVTDIMNYAGGGGFPKRQGIPIGQRHKYTCAIPRVLSKMGFIKQKNLRVVPERSMKRSKFFAFPAGTDPEKLNVTECKGKG